MKKLRSYLALPLLAVVLLVNAWLFWPAAWRFTPEAAVLRAGGKVTRLTSPENYGKSAVTLPASITDDELEQMTALDDLQPAWVLFEGGRVGNRGVASLKRLSQLRGLSLQSTNVDDEVLAALAALPHLETLNLDGCQITDQGLERIEKFPSLKAVAVRGTAVTRNGVERLKAARPGLRVDSSYSADPD
jgi:hypothetical protein